MKKIVILVDQLNSHGGIERLVAMKANYWTEYFNYEVTIIATEQYEKDLVYDLSEKVNFIDLEINYDRDKSYFSSKNVFKFFKNVIKIQTYILNEKPDFVLVASHIPITYFLPFLIKKSKTIKEFHFTKFNRPTINFKTKMLNFIESKYDFLVVLSQEEQKFYPSKNTVVIPNPIEISNQKNIPIQKRENVVLFVGRIAPVKRLEKMIEIWKQFISKNPHWKLHIFGTQEGEYFEQINFLVAQNQLQQSVIFKGQSSTINEELSKAKALLLTSEQECFPMVILEAQAKGLVVFSYDCPTGPRNIIHSNTDGILIPNNDLEEYVSEMDRVLNNVENLQFISTNAVRNAYQFSVDKVMNQWNIYIFNL